MSQFHALLHSSRRLRQFSPTRKECKPPKGEHGEVLCLTSYRSQGLTFVCSSDMYKTQTRVSKYQISCSGVLIVPFRFLRANLAMSAQHLLISKLFLAPRTDKFLDPQMNTILVRC